jgi:hypothetical protein
MYLLNSGESYITLPLALKSKENWAHTTRATKLFQNDDGTLRRECVREQINGIIYHADVEDRQLEKHNIETIKNSKIPCWPPIKTIESMIDRFELLDRCSRLGFILHDVQILNEFTDKINVKFPYVLKVGNIHRGEGKYLIRKQEDILCWEGKASAETYFEGESYRVFIVGVSAFCVHVTNDESWIKNTVGGEVEVVSEPIKGLIEHAREICAAFKLELAGIDYVVTKNSFYLLEVNIFPGLYYGDEEAKRAIEQFLRNRMALVELTSK